MIFHIIDEILVKEFSCFFFAGLSPLFVCRPEGRGEREKWVKVWCWEIVGLLFFFFFFCCLFFLKLRRDVFAFGLVCSLRRNTRRRRRKRNAFLHKRIK